MLTLDDSVIVVSNRGVDVAMLEGVMMTWHRKGVNLKKDTTCCDPMSQRAVELFDDASWTLDGSKQRDDTGTEGIIPLKQQRVTNHRKV